MSSRTARAAVTCETPSPQLSCRTEGSFEPGTNFPDPFNGKSRAAEISKVLDSYIPNVARMKDQLRKYNVAFTKTAAENEKLKEKNKTLSASLDKATEGSVLKRLEDAKLRQDYEAALKTLDSIPPEVIRFYENRSTQEPAMRHDK